MFRPFDRLAKAGARLLATTDASVMPTFVLALVPLVGLMGAAVDYSRASSVRTSMQATLDAALLVGARDGSTNWANVATNFFNGNVQSKGATIGSPVFQLNSSRAYTATVSGTVPTDFMGVVGVSSIGVSVV